MGSKKKSFFAKLVTRWRQMDPHLRALYVFNAISLVGGIVYGMYYGVFLYRQTFTLSILALDGLLGGLGTWLGYVGGAALISRSGYRRCFRVAFATWMLTAGATVLLANHIAEWFIVIAVLKAIPTGMYTANCDTIMLREVCTRTRNGFLHTGYWAAERKRRVNASVPPAAPVSLVASR